MLDIIKPFLLPFIPSLDTSLSSSIFPYSSTTSSTSLPSPYISSLLLTTPSFYPILPFNYNVSYNKVFQALKERKSFLYLSLNSFPYTFLKVLRPPFINILISIISTS